MICLRSYHLLVSALLLANLAHQTLGERIEKIIKQYENLGDRYGRAKDRIRLTKALSLPRSFGDWRQNPVDIPAPAPAPIPASSMSPQAPLPAFSHSSADASSYSSDDSASSSSATTSHLWPPHSTRAIPPLFTQTSAASSASSGLSSASSEVSNDWLNEVTEPKSPKKRSRMEPQESFAQAGASNLWPPNVQEAPTMTNPSNGFQFTASANKNVDQAPISFATSSASIGRNGHATASSSAVGHGGAKAISSSTAMAGATQGRPPRYSNHDNFGDHDESNDPKHVGNHKATATAFSNNGAGSESSSFAQVSSNNSDKTKRVSFSNEEEDVEETPNSYRRKFSSTNYVKDVDKFTRDSGSTAQASARNPASYNMDKNHFHGNMRRKLFREKDRTPHLLNSDSRFWHSNDGAMGYDDDDIYDFKPEQELRRRSPQRSASARASAVSGGHGYGAATASANAGIWGRGPKYD